jgi:hypothetical protein
VDQIEQKDKEQHKQQKIVEEKKKQTEETKKESDKREDKKQQKKLKKEEEKKQRLQDKIRKKEEKQRIQRERWSRWGHTRKPNGLVLAIYALLDWFGDFAPMFKALSRGVGKGAKSSWGLLVEGTMTTINVLLVIGIIYVSVGHSYNMLLYAGASGNEALVMVAVFETVFVYCSVVIDYSNKKGIRNPWAWVGFIIGFFFVEISNFMGMANNWIGNAVGITLPILLLVMKKVLEWQYKKQPKKQKRQKESISWIKKLWLNLCFWKKNSHSEEEPKDLTTTSHTHENKEQVSQQNNSLTQNTQEEVLTQSETAQEKEKSSHTTRTEESLTPSLTEEKFSQEGLTHEAQNDEEISSQKNESHSSVRTKAHTEVKTTSQKGDSSHTHTSEKNSHTQVSQQNNSLTQNTQGNDSHTQENKSQSKSHTRKKSRTKSQKKSHTNSSQQNQVTDMDEIKKVAIAMKMADEKKKFPSIKKLSKEAKCSEWNARKALNDLKKAN